jgi:hypothetical protein
MVTTFKDIEKGTKTLIFNLKNEKRTLLVAPVKGPKCQLSSETEKVFI